MKNVFFNFLNSALIFVFVLLFTRLNAVASSLQASVKLQGETLNFEVAGQKNWDYDVRRLTEKGLTKVQLLIKSAKPEQLNNIKNVANPFVKSVQLLKETLDGATVVEFTLADSTIEAFDYLTDQPSKLIIDFYKNEEATAAKPETKPTQATTDSKSVGQKNTKKAKDTIETKSSQSARVPAQTDFLKVQEDNGILTFVDNNVDLRGGLFDGGDEKFKRFSIKDNDISLEAILKGYENYYLKFPMVNQEFSFWKQMKENTPEFEVVTKETQENKEARLLLQLFNKNKLLVFKKTLGWFEKKYPNSEYLEQFNFMNAEASLKLYKEDQNQNTFDEAINLYSKAMGLYPKSPLTERTSLFVGFLFLDKKDYLSAARKFNTHIGQESYKGKPSQDYAKLGLAYSLQKVNKLEDAINLLVDVEKNSKNDMTKAEAAVRQGDFYFEKEQHQNAVESYIAAQKKYAKLMPAFPNVYFNKMESLFRLKKPELSHAAAFDFVQRFPSHFAAPYALTRVGELLEILGADQSRSVGAFLETHFRYGDNPKTIVARLHLMSARLKGMKEQEVKEALEKMEDLASKSDLENVQQFKTSMIADGFNRRKEFDKAIEVLTKFYQKEPSLKDSDQIKNRIVKNINEQIIDFSDQGDFKNVLKTYQKYADNWIKMNPRIDTQFYVAKAYQEAGSCRTALKKYEKVSRDIASLGTDLQSLKIKRLQKIPSEDLVKLRQAQCLYDTDDFQKSYEVMQEIKNIDKLPAKEQIDRVLYASLIYEKKGEVNAAVRYLTELTKVWKDQPELLTEPTLKLADLEVKRKNVDVALQQLISLNIEKLSVEQQQSVLKKTADIALAHHKKDQAIAAMTQLLEKFSEQQDLASYRFKLGDLYFASGERSKATQVWQGFQGSDSEFWKKLADNKMKDAQWRDENKKYLKRIPAMTKSNSIDQSGEPK